MQTIHAQDPETTASGPQAAARERQRRYAAEVEPQRRESMREIEELFDRRLDGVAAARRFGEKLRWHVAVFGDGTAGTSAARILGDLTREERRLQQARAGAG
jgi:hypothetical protein